jgi:outer membrane protein assembly factor BamB
MGVTTEKNLPLDWGGPDKKSILWKSPLPPTLLQGEPDHNQSSPIVVGDRVIVTTAHWKKGADRANSQPEHHVACYSATSGKQLWDRIVKPGPWIIGDLRGGYAVPTPIVSNGRIFAVFGSSIIHALDLEGKPLWSQVIANHEKFDVALASSPVTYKDTVITLLDKRAPASTIIAWDAASGKIRWEVKRPETDFSHTTPVLTTAGNKTQMLVSSTHALQGISPANGETIWECRWGRSLWPVSSPVMAKGLAFAIGGRGGHPGLIVDPSGSGDVSKSHIRSKVKPMSEGLSSPIAFGDLVFRLHSGGWLRCFRITTGEQLFQKKLPNADPAVSPIVTPEGRIYFASAGRSVVIQAGPKLEVIGNSDLGEPSVAAAAVTDGKLILKGQRHLFVIGKPDP